MSRFPARFVLRWRVLGFFARSLYFDTQQADAALPTQVFVEENRGNESRGALRARRGRLADPDLLGAYTDLLCAGAETGSWLRDRNRTPVASACEGGGARALPP